LAVLFRSDFDSNTVSPFGWTGVNLSGTNLVEVTSEHPFNGTYGLKCTLAIAAPAGSFAGVYQQFIGSPNRDHIFMRAMNVIVDQMPTTEGQRLAIHGAWAERSATAIGLCGLAKIGGVLKWYSHYRHNGAFIAQNGGTPQLNTPYCVEMEIKQNSAPGVADGAQRVYVNGVVTLEITGIINDDRVINYVAFGLNNSEGNATSPVHMWGDAFVLADAYIGPAAGLQPNLTVKSDRIVDGVPTTVDQNVPVYIDGVLVGNTPLTVPLSTGTHTVSTEGEISR